MADEFLPEPVTREETYWDAILRSLKRIEALLTEKQPDAKASQEAPKPTDAVSKRKRR